MSATAKQTEDQVAIEQLTLRRIYPFTRERLFAAWSKPEALKRWFHPGAAMTTPIVESDLRVGGRYRIVMENADGDQFAVGGTYQAIDPPAKLAFTWHWVHETAEPETLVTIELIARSADETELILTHSQFAGEGERNNHEQGWIGTLAQLTESGVLTTV